MILLTLALAALPAWAIAPLVNATLQPGEIALGESAQLTITTSGNGAGALNLPTVAGLEFGVVGQSRSIQIVNGATLVTSSVLVRVTPKTVGIFTIPSLAPNSAPLVLRVNPEGTTSGNTTPGQLNLPGTRSGTHSTVKLTADGAAFIRLVLPKKDIYVGESIPVDIEVGLRDGMVKSLNGLPTLTGADFTLNNLSRQPDRAQKLIDGKGFTLLTWHSVLAGVKPGKFTLTVESPVTLLIRTRPQGESRLEDMLGDPFLQNFFGATVPKDTTLTSQPADLTVSSLPTEGRPPDFSGAVGSFKISDEASATSVAAGDPLTLRMHVTGSGNFDRVDTRMLQHLEDWKTYPPKSSFKAADGLGLKGEKTFEQPLIAAHPGPQTLPALSFSYFDPNTHHYETAQGQPLTVNVTPSAADRSEAAPPLNAPSAADARDRFGLRPDHVVTANTHASLRPLYLRMPFLTLPSVLALGFLGSWLSLRRPARTHPNRRVRHATREAQRIIRELEAAARAGDAARFFTLARTALTPSVTAASDPNDALAELTALADETNYAGEHPQTIDFARWLDLVRARLLPEGTV